MGQIRGGCVFSEVCYNFFPFIYSARDDISQNIPSKCYLHGFLTENWIIVRFLLGREKFSLDTPTALPIAICGRVLPYWKRIWCSSVVWCAVGNVSSDREYRIFKAFTSTLPNHNANSPVSQQSMDFIFSVFNCIIPDPTVIVLGKGQHFKMIHSNSFAIFFKPVIYYRSGSGNFLRPTILDYVFLLFYELIPDSFVFSPFFHQFSEKMLYVAVICLLVTSVNNV